MSDDCRRILVVDGSEADAARMRTMLADDRGGGHSVECACSLSAALDRLGEEWDAVLAELNLPDSRGLDTLDSLLQAAGPIPVIALTGLDDEELGRACVERGAQDYLVKGEMDDAHLARALRYAVERKHTVEELRDREHYYRALLHSMHEDILVVDRDYRIVDVNNSFLLTVGRSREEVVGQRCFEVSHGYGQPCTQRGRTCELRRVFETGQPASCRHVHVGPGGTDVDVDLLLSPLYDSSGNVTHVIEAARDVSDLVAKEKALRESEEKYRSLYESMAEGVCLHEIVRDDQGAAVDYRIIDVNPAYESITGYTREQVVGELASQVYGTGEAPFLATYARVVEKGEPAAFETHWAPMGKHFAISAFRPEGDRFATVFVDITGRKEAEDALVESQRWSQTILDGMPGVAMLVKSGTRDIVAANRPAREAGAVPGRRCYEEWISRDSPCSWCLAPEVWQTRTERRTEFEAGGSVWDAYWYPVGEDMYLHFAFDVTEQRRTEQQLRQAAKMESVGRLAGGIAHDFNNLLTAIIGNVDLNLPELQEGSQLHSDLLQVKQAAKRAADLTRQLLTFSRQQTSAERQTFDVNDALRSIVDMLRHVIPESISVSLETPMVPVLLDGDRTQVEQIVMNLAINARDAMPEGGRLEIRSEEAVLTTRHAEAIGLRPGPYAVVSVSDTGPGVSAEIRERMFEPFFTTKEAGRGTGLGLATVYGIVKDHGGAVDCRSEPGRGTTFSVYLPLSESTSSNYSERSEFTPVEFTGETVLVVEDEGSLRDLVARVLTDSGFDVVVAAGGKEALALLDEEGLKVDLLLTDIVMPGMDGRELARQVRTRSPGAKVLAMSGYAGEDGAIDGGAPLDIPFLRKPFTRRMLVMTVKSVLEEA